MGVLGINVDSPSWGHEAGDVGDVVLGELRPLCWSQGETRLEMLGTLC